MLTIRPSINSEKSSFSLNTLCSTRARGYRILAREKILQKSFFGVGPFFHR